MREYIEGYYSFAFKQWRESSAKGELSFKEYVDEVPSLPEQYHRHLVSSLEQGGVCHPATAKYHLPKNTAEYLFRKVGQFWTGKKLFTELWEEL